MESSVQSGEPHNLRSVLNIFQKYYLSVIPKKTLFRSLFQLDFCQPFSQNIQNEILDATVNNKLSQKYSPPTSYKKFFLRLIIDEVERSGCEASENLLFAYTDVLKKPATDDTPAFHSYVLNETSVITLQENPSVVINGTTGLRTWEASKFLTEWCYENAHLFQNRRILELGCGTGLLGIAILKTCQPSSFVFTDKSSDVLRLLQTNVNINFSKDELAVQSKEISDSAGNSPEIKLFYGNFYRNSQKSLVEISYLEWNEFTKKDAINFAPDILLGADVVYDPSCINSLINTLHTFLSNGTMCAYVAAAVRNTATHSLFIEKLDSAGLAHMVMQNPKESLFIYDKSSIFRLYRIYV